MTRNDRVVVVDRDDPRYNQKGHIVDSSNAGRLWLVKFDSGDEEYFNYDQIIVIQIPMTKKLIN